MAISRTSAIASCSAYPAATSDSVTTVIDGIAHLALCESSYLDPRSGMICRDVLRHLTNFLPNIQALPPAALVDTINCKKIGLSRLGITKPEDLATWLKSLGESKNHLRYLNPQDIPLSDEIIELLPPSLEELRISKCSDATLLKLSKQLVNLKKLNFIFNRNITDCSSNRNITGCHFDKLPEGLQELDCFACELTDDAIAKLSMRCTKLVKLHMDENFSITGSTFDQLPITLQELQCYSTAVTDTAISKLIARCTNLRVLNISNNSGVTGASFDQLPESLEKLVCSNCQIDDTAIAKLNRLTNLLKLYIIYNDVTGSTFDQLPTSLQYLYCSNCSIKDEAVAKLSKCTNLVYLGMDISNEQYKTLKAHLPYLQ